MSGTFDVDGFCVGVSGGTAHGSYTARYER